MRERYRFPCRRSFSFSYPISGQLLARIGFLFLIDGRGGLAFNSSGSSSPIFVLLRNCTVLTGSGVSPAAWDAGFLFSFFLVETVFLHYLCLLLSHTNRPSAKITTGIMTINIQNTTFA